MEVSNFELIFKPQAPASPPGVSVDRVIQGYFLEITNLETKSLSFRLEFIAVPPPPGTTNGAFRSLDGNTLVFVDTPGTDNQQGVLVPTADPSVFRPGTGLVTIAPKATALVAVLPSAFEPMPIDPTPLVQPNFEVRGFVRITLPALFRIPPFRFVPQSRNPVRVLLTPQNRATFLTADNAISGQTQASLPLATGAALNQVVPDPGGPLVLTPVELDRDMPNIASFLQLQPELATPAMLAVLLGQIDPAPAELEKFNKALGDAGVQVAIKPRANKGS